MELRATVMLALVSWAILTPPVSVLSGPYLLHSFRKLQLTHQFYGEGAAYGDINGDGTMDVVSGPFWYEGPGFAKKHAFYEPKPYPVNGYSLNFIAFTYDFNHDGHLDIFVVGFPGKESQWYENPGVSESAAYWKRHVIFETTDNESPALADLTGDGFPELICDTGERYGYAEPSWDDPTKPWVFHAISGKIAGGRFTHGLGVGDIDGDGRKDVLVRDGWLRQPTDAHEGSWVRNRVSFAPDAAQILAYDFDGDGDSDVFTAVHCHQWGLMWHEQRRQSDGHITFTPHSIMGKSPEESPYGLVFTQPHALALADINLDGIKDVVVGKRWWAHNGHDPGANDPAVLYWFETARTPDGTVDFVPHLIDDDSGVGTQVTVGDLNADRYPDVVVGNKKGTFVFLHKVKKVTQHEWEEARPKRRVSP